MGVGSDHGRAGLGKPFYVNVVADTVARLRVVHAVLSGKPLQKEMVVRVFVVELDDVVVYVLNRQGNLDPAYAYLLQLHAGHRAGSILEQGLIYLDAHLLTRLDVAAILHVLLEDLGHQVICQYGSPLTYFPLFSNPFYTFDYPRRPTPTRGGARGSLRGPGDVVHKEDQGTLFTNTATISQNSPHRF